MEESFPYVIIQEIFTETCWLRKIADGPWRRVDCSLYDGRPPVVFLHGHTWAMTETWKSI